MRVVRGVIIIAMLVLLLVFIYNNHAPVSVALVHYRTPELPLYLVLVIVFALGLLLGALYFGLKILRLRRALARCSRKREKVGTETLGATVPSGGGSTGAGGPEKP